MIKSKITELKEKLEKLEESFAYGEIDRSLFQKLAPKLKTEGLKKGNGLFLISSLFGLHENDFTAEILSAMKHWIPDILLRSGSFS